MCVEGMRALDRCLRSNSSMFGSCCSLLGVTYFACAGYTEGFFASESGPGLPASFYEVQLPGYIAGVCWNGGGSGSGSGGDYCDYDRIIPEVYRWVGCALPCFPYCTVVHAKSM
jgi:hypothetical protein